MRKIGRETFFEIGDRIGDRVIIAIEPHEKKRKTYYQYRCDCGNVGWCQHDPMLLKLKNGLHRCPKCLRNGVSKMPSFAYKEAVEIQRFVDRYWR